MTSRDIMPFGKFGKAKLGEQALTLEQVKTRHPDYVNWLVQQDGFATKNPALYEYFVNGKETTTEKERTNLSDERILLDPMDDAFKAYWRRAYGERLRTLGELNYIAYLRVACNTWNEARIRYAQGPAVAALPPDIPAPQLSSVFTAPLPRGHDEPASPDTPF